MTVAKRIKKREIPADTTREEFINKILLEKFGAGIGGKA